MKIKIILYPLIMCCILSCVENDKTLDIYKVKKEVWAKAPSKIAANITGGAYANKAPYKWSAPKGWQEKTASSMRIGSFTLTSKDKKQVGDLSIVTLPARGYRLAPNVNRWRGQISLASVTEESIVESRILVESPLGDFTLVFLKNKTTQEGILGALKLNKKDHLFIKLKGNISLLEEKEKEFKAFLRSFHDN